MYTAILEYHLFILEYHLCNSNNMYARYGV